MRELIFYSPGVTILLSLSVFQMIVADMTPPTSMAVPLIGGLVVKEVGWKRMDGWMV